MTDLSNSFRIAVNASKEVILQILINKYKTISNVSKDTKYFVLKNNNVVINENEDFDAVLALEDEDAYLYYENNLDYKIKHSKKVEVEHFSSNQIIMEEDKN